MMPRPNWATFLLPGAMPAWVTRLTSRVKDDKLNPAPQTVITRRIEFDAGHRIPNHASKCRNVHGHRYVLEVTVAGPVIGTKGASDEGMVVDFSVLKELMVQLVADPWDHAFLVYWQDKAMLAALYHLPATKFVSFTSVPTAENLASAAFGLLQQPLAEKGLTLQQVRLFETPNSWADVTMLSFHPGSATQVVRPSVP